MVSINVSGNEILSNKKRTERVRVFVVKETTATPIAGIPVQILAGFHDPSLSSDWEVPLSWLASDQYGYLSYRIGPLAQEPNLQHIWLRPFGSSESQIDVFSTLSAGIDPTVVTLRVTDDLNRPPYAPPAFPSIPDPDIKDWKVSPASLTSDDIIKLGQGDCEEFLHSIVPEQRYRFLQVIQDDDLPESLKPVENPEPCESNQEFSGFFSRKPRERCYRRGVLLEYEVTWTPLGHGLGRLLYSLPLAPCEAVDIAIIDWQRQDETARTEDTNFAEQLRHSQLRERDIEEAIKATLSESQLGGSFLTGAAGALSGSWKIIDLGITSAIGGALAGTRGKRKLGAQTTQHIVDTLTQATTMTRRLNSTVIVQASQEEKEIIQTRTVRNNNHCHSLTILYYEVVRHYLLQVKLVEKRDAIFIKYRPINDLSAWELDASSALPTTGRFTDKLVFRYHKVLRDALLDPSLECGFSAIAQYLCDQENFERKPPERPPNDNLVDKLEILVGTSNRSSLGRGDAILIFIKGVGDKLIRLLEEQLDGSKTDRISPYIETAGPAGRFQSGQRDIVFLFPAEPIRWEDVRSIRVVISGRASWSINYLRVYTEHNELRWTLCEIARDITINDSSSFEQPVSNYGMREPIDLLDKNQYCCREALIEHLNQNLLYYCRAIWLAQDPGERSMIFDAFSIDLPDPENSGHTLHGRLTDFIENRVVGVSGDYVVFPLTITQLANEYAESEEAIEDESVISESVISLPTRGVFAEAKLSHCNACETRDVTRYWDWTESPCPEPPEIAPVQAGEHTVVQPPEGIPSAMPAPVVNIVNPPSAPDPMGMAAALEVLRTPNIFRDMSAVSELSDLLQKLSDGAVSMAQARSQARNILGKTEQGSESGGDRRSGSSSTSREDPQTMHDRTMVFDNAIDDAVDNGSLSEEEARNLRRQQRQSMISETSGSEEEISGIDIISLSLISQYSDGNTLPGEFMITHYNPRQSGMSVWPLRVEWFNPSAASVRIPAVSMPQGPTLFQCQTARIQTPPSILDRHLTYTLPGPIPDISIPLNTVIPTEKHLRVIQAREPITVTENTKDILIRMNGVLEENEFPFTVNLSTGVEGTASVETSISNQLKIAIEGKLDKLFGAAAERVIGPSHVIDLGLSPNIELGAEVEGTITVQYISALTMTVEVLEAGGTS